MRTIQMTLDPELVIAVDKVARKLGTTRSAFTRQALREALRRVREKSLEDRHREGYRRRPPKRGEFTAWEKEQVWTD
jgi:metal-responsive CopG/Arc/MetJ family transcriptional regulator